MLFENKSGGVWVSHNSRKHTAPVQEQPAAFHCRVVTVTAGREQAGLLPPPYSLHSWRCLFPSHQPDTRVVTAVRQMGKLRPGGRLWRLPRVPEPERRGPSFRTLPPHIPGAPFAVRRRRPQRLCIGPGLPPTLGAAHPSVQWGWPVLWLAMKSELVFQAMDFPRAAWGVSESVKTEQRPRGAPRRPSRLSPAGLAARGQATPLSPVRAPGAPPSPGSASDPGWLGACPRGLQFPPLRGAHTYLLWAHAQSSSSLGERIYVSVFPFRFCD